MTTRDKLRARLKAPVSKRDAGITISATALVTLLSFAAKAMGPVVVAPARFEHDSSRRENRYLMDSVRKTANDSLLRRDMGDVRREIGDVKAMLFRVDSNAKCNRAKKPSWCD